MTEPNVTITERAAHRIGAILKSEGNGAMLRISVEGGGCSGFQYKFDIERAQAEDDLVIARDGAVPGRLGSGFRRRPDRRLVPGQQSERHRILRLRHQLLGLTPAARDRPRRRPATRGQLLPPGRQTNLTLSAHWRCQRKTWSSVQRISVSGSFPE